MFYIVIVVLKGDDYKNIIDLVVYYMDDVKNMDVFVKVVKKILIDFNMYILNIND